MPTCLAPKPGSFATTMAFHIEVGTGRRHARSFNLTEEELGRTVLDPWLSGRPILLVDRKWKRDDEDSRLRILEGPELSVQDLAFSQGWANAERSATVPNAPLGVCNKRAQQPCHPEPACPGL